MSIDPAQIAAMPSSIACQKPSASAPAIIVTLLGMGAMITVSICSRKKTMPANAPALSMSARSSSTEPMRSNHPFRYRANTPAARASTTSTARAMRRARFVPSIISLKTG